MNQNQNQSQNQNQDQNQNQNQNQSQNQPLTNETSTTGSSESLHHFGWNSQWEASFAAASASLPAGCVPARVIAQFTNQYRIMTAGGELSAEVSGKFQFQANARSEFPAVGDWVAAAPMAGEKRAIIHSVLPRRSAMIRRAAGSVPEEQVIGSNIDTLFIVGALNGDYNVSRIERYLVLAWESGATPVVLLTKADLCDTALLSIAEVEAAAPGVPVHAVSAVADIGREALSPYLQPGRTIAVTGSSGVGKSTLLNWLAGDELMQTQGIREDDARGRHTTTHRELFPLPGGFIMMDTPGMRELQLWESEGGWQEAFADVEALAASCRFRDCRHERELGCAVREALRSGALDERRYASYKKTGRELAHQLRKEQSVSKRQQKSADKRREARTTFSKRMIDAD